MTIELSHPYHLDESILIFVSSGSLSVVFHFSMIFMLANRKVPDGMPHFAVLHLGLFCLPSYVP